MEIIRRVLHKKGFFRLAFPPGHFASPIPNFKEILEDDSLFNQDQNILDIELNAQEQFELFDHLLQIALGAPYLKDHDLRYQFDNHMLGPIDGLMLYGILCHFNPQKIIEVGSGFSSALMLDVNNVHRNNEMELTFIEPYPDRLKSLLRKEDYSSVNILEKKIQDVDLSIFDSLSANDILFLDTSHIVKTGSDVNFWLFNILPRLKSGVIIHIHDIFWPFEYPREWIQQQKCYTELYLIRAFLMNNAAYEIKLFNHFIQYSKQDRITSTLPILNSSNGGSLWIQKK